MSLPDWTTSVGNAPFTPRNDSRTYKKPRVGNNDSEHNTYIWMRNACVLLMIAQRPTVPDFASW